MKTLSSALQSHLEQEVTTLASCWHITRRDGVELFLTDHDVDLVVGGETYKAATGYSRTALESSASLAVGNLDVMGAIDDEAITVADIRAGRYDHARVEMFLVNWAAPADGDIPQVAGRLGEVRGAGQNYTAEVRSIAQQLSQQVAEIYTADCRAALGDARCKVSLAALTVTGTVTTVTDRRSFRDSTRAEADGFFAYGVLTWTSGANNGLTAAVKRYLNTGGRFELFQRMPADIELGDGYSVYRGCDKTLATCRDVFDNVANFRGEPFVPGTDAAVRYPDGH